MKKQISSSLTLFYKYLFPWLFVLIIILGILSSPETPFYGKDNGNVVLLLILLFMPILFLIFRWARRIMIVRIDEENIYISNNKDEIVFPLNEVEEVKQNFLATFNPEYVTIILKHQTVFGRKVHFIPKFRYINLFQHQIVRELRSLIRQ